MSGKMTHSLPRDENGNKHQQKAPCKGFSVRRKGTDGSSCSSHLLSCCEINGPPSYADRDDTSHANVSPSSVLLNPMKLPSPQTTPEKSIIVMEKSIISEKLGSGSLSWRGSDCTAKNLFLGLAWPPRSYTCSFCQREFRSAQALGGHMNVHRRDRARLRESPPGEPTNPSGFFGPNLNSEPVSSHLSPPTLNPPLQTLSSDLNYSKCRKNVKAVDVLKKTERRGNDTTCKVSKRKNIDRTLHLETAAKITVKENIDLDLRLGYA